MNNNCKHDRKHYDCPYCVIDELKAKAEAMQKVVDKMQGILDGIINAYPQLEDLIVKKLKDKPTGGDDAN